MPSYGELIYDCMELARGLQLSDDTEISEDQVKFHLNNQRALWLRNEYNKPGRSIDTQITQDLGCLSIVEVDAAECCDVTLGCNVLRTEKQMPKFLELHSGPAVTRVGPVHKLKTPFTYTNYNKAIYTASGKYFKGVTAFLLNKYMYLMISDPSLLTLEYINVRGVFEDPSALEDFACDNSGDKCFSLDDEYPINTWMIPYIKEQVLKQLGIAIQIPKDSANDAQEQLGKQ